jgi:hypothetical protein
MSLRGILAVALALCVPGPAWAQWSAPSFLPPRPGDNIGVYLSSAGNFGIQGIWRQHMNLNLGVRGGYLDSDVHGGVVVAAESWGLLLQAGQGLPVDLSWTAGVGAVFNSGTWMEIPVGVSVGTTVALTPVTLQLYGHPRLALVLTAGDEQEDETELEGLFDLGMDVILAGGLRIRTGLTMGRFDALGVGVAIPFGRRVEVR